MSNRLAHKLRGTAGATPLPPFQVIQLGAP